MIKYRFDSSGNRPLEEIKGLKIVDIGGANSFAHGFLDAIIEIREPQAACNHKFIGDINMPETWEPILKHVANHGKWDYAICTHTLEDISNPLFVSRMIEKIAKKGLIVEPSKYRELARFSGNFRGFMHHRWLFDIIDGELIAFPKSAYLEESIFDNVHLLLPGREELVIEWEGEIGMRVINDDMPFNGDQHMKEMYQLLLK